MLKLNPYILFPGSCRDAMKFYQSILGGDLKLQTYSEAKIPHSEKEKDKIIHARLESPDIVLMASDDNEKSPVNIGNNVQLSISGDDEKKLTDIFNKLSKDGTVKVPLKKEFWGDTFGMLSDKFNVNWMIDISGKK